MHELFKQNYWRNLGHFNTGDLFKSKILILSSLHQLNSLQWTRKGLKFCTMSIYPSVWFNIKSYHNPSVFQSIRAIFQFSAFWACMNWRLMWASLIEICLLVIVNFSHFSLLLLKNHWAIFTQTWCKVPLGEENSDLFKWRPRLFQREIILPIS